MLFLFFSSNPSRLLFSLLFDSYNFSLSFIDFYNSPLTFSRFKLYCLRSSLSFAFSLFIYSSLSYSVVFLPPLDFFNLSVCSYTSFSIKDS